jgi:hypothetical protein
MGDFASWNVIIESGVSESEIVEHVLSRIEALARKFKIYKATSTLHVQVLITMSYPVQFSRFFCPDLSLAK